MSSLPVTQHKLSTSEQLGAILRATRKGKKLSQGQIAAKLMLSQRRISYLELHPEELSLKQLMAWATALDLDINVAAKVAATHTSTDTEW